MRESDQQRGKPMRLYQNTKANIVALGLGAGDEGCVAYATDTNEFGTFDGAAWAWGSGNHDLLGTRHSDTTTDAVSAGSMIIGNATPAWDELVHPGTAYHLQTTALNSLAWVQNITMADGTWIGIGAGFERIVFDAAGDICVMGAKFGVGTLAPGAIVEINDTAPVLLHLHETDAGTGVARFTNTDDAAGWYVGISSQEKFGISRNVDINAGGEFCITQAGYIGCQVVAPAGQFHIDQPSNTAAIPVLVLDQADTSEGLINFIALDRGVITGATNSTVSVRVELNNTVYRLALYADA